MSKKSISRILVRALLVFLKERGFGNSCKDKWDGFGGKLEEGETIREAAARFFFVYLFIYFSSLDNV
jgi:8-oxo-dGTP pyrophosphatase MutT (NUDIX family)